MVVIFATAFLACLLALLALAALKVGASNKVVLVFTYSIVAVVGVGLAAYEPYSAWLSENSLRAEQERAEAMIETLGGPSVYLKYLSVQVGS